MSKKKPTKKKPWQPLKQDSPTVRKVMEDKLIAGLRSEFPDMSDDEIRCAVHKDEVWGNDRYTVSVTFKDNRKREGYLEIGVHNHNRTTIVPWAHMQQIKNEVAGPEREAVMIYPAESRLVDTANEYWIYVYPTGEFPRWESIVDSDGNPVEIPLGMNQGRNVQYENRNPMLRSKQGEQLVVNDQNEEA